MSTNKKGCGTKCKNSGVEGIMNMKRQINIQGLIDESKEDCKLFSKRATQADIQALVDGGQMLTSHIKEQTAKLDQLKTAMKAIATLKEQHKFEGSNGSIATVSDLVVRSITVGNLIKFLTKINKKKLFNDFVAVKLTATLKSFGDVALTKFMESDTNKYHSCSFTKSK